MKKPTKVLFTHWGLALLAASTMWLTACGESTTTPTGLSPRDADKALAGAHDKVYTFAVDPMRDTPHLNFGNSYLVIPAHAVCDLETSSYGPDQWTAPCVSETKRFSITATVHNSQTDHPSVDFSPALRFNPAYPLPNLFLVVTDSVTLNNMATIVYCANSLDAATCVDESANDPSLASIVSSEAKTIYRRIRHFSGYLLAE